MNWAVKNKTTVNLLRTVEVVFHRPNVSYDLLLSVMLNVGRVAVAKLLGVNLRHDLNFSQHVESSVVTCNQRQGSDISAIDSVCKAIVLNKILYALPVFCGYLTEGQKHMLQRVLHRASRRGFSPYYYDLEILAEKAHLFHHSCRKGHCLNHLYAVKLRPLVPCG